MLNENLNKLLDLAKGQRSQNEFALHCGVSSSALTRIKNGDYNATPDFLKKIANRAHNDVTYEQLMIAAGFLTEEPTSHPSYEIDLDEVTLMPVIGSISAGYDGQAIEEILAYYPITDKAMHGYKKEDCFVLRVKGNSMYPNFHDGDYVLVHRQTSVDSGDIAVIMYNGDEATLKKVIYAQCENWMELIPNNPEYQTKRIEGVDLQDCRVLGKVMTIVYRENL